MRELATRYIIRVIHHVFAATKTRKGLAWVPGAARKGYANVADIQDFHLLFDLSFLLSNGVVAVLFLHKNVRQ